MNLTKKKKNVERKKFWKKIFLSLHISFGDVVVFCLCTRLRLHAEPTYCDQGLPISDILFTAKREDDK